MERWARCATAAAMGLVVPLCAAPAANAARGAAAEADHDAVAVPVPERQVLSLINQSRAQAGLPPFTIAAGLTRTAAAHDLAMAGGCGLSHQCAGETAPAGRATAANPHWTKAGENIGEGGPADDSDTAIAQTATALTQDMLDERPPDDHHRRNILSGAFRHIGIAVYRDASGSVWMTQDFSD